MATTELEQRKAELVDYSSSITQVLIDPQLTLELQRAQSYEVHGAIGAVARNLCIIGEEDEALIVAGELLTATGSNGYIARGVYGDLVAQGSVKAIDIYRKLIEANKETIGDEGSEYSIYQYCDDLIGLYRAGDEAAGQMARKMIEEADDDELEIFGVKAAKLFQAGDETAFPLLLDTADRAIAHHHAKEGEVSELDRLRAATTEARLGTPRPVPGADVIRHLSRYLKTLAEDLIKKGDLARAEQLQSRLPKEVDRVHLDALKVTEGLDETGSYQENLDRMVESKAEVFDSVLDVPIALEILKAAAIGGNSTAIKQLQAMVQMGLKEQYFSGYELDAASALFMAGEMSEEEFNKILDLDDSRFHKIDILEELGRTEEALQLARDEFDANPYDEVAAYTLLRYEYNPEAMDLVQNHVAAFDTNMISTLSRRARWLGELAKHIQQLQAAQLQPEV